MCTAIGLCILVLAFISINWIGYKVFNYVEHYIDPNEKEKPHWIIQCLLGDFIIILLGFSLFLCYALSYTIWSVAPIVGCYILGN